MVSLVGRMLRPVLANIGRRLAAATTAEWMRRIVDRANVLIVPPRGVRVEPAAPAGPDGLRVQVSDRELLSGDSPTFAQRALDPGVEVALGVENGRWHDRHLQAPAVPEARSAVERIGRFVIERTGG